MCMFVCMNTHENARVGIHVGAYVWTRVEGRGQPWLSLPRCSVPFLVETGSVTWPGTHHVSEAGWPVCSYLTPQH